MTRWLSGAIVVLMGTAATAALQQTAPPAPQTPSVLAPRPATSAEIAAAINGLGSFDFKMRTDAARRLRRVSPAVVAPQLVRAAREHQDEYVRFRALVILTGVSDADARPLMRELVADHNDRVRTVVYQYFEHHPDPAILPALIAKLPDERSEFVRPALTRALAAHGTDPRARAALQPLVLRGEDLFRGAVIGALGDYDGKSALADIIQVAKLDGPLQDDAVTAIGKLGGATERSLLASLRQSAAADVQPTVSAALCLLQIECAAQEKYLYDTLAFAVSITGTDFQPLLRGVVHGLGMLAERGNERALSALLTTGAKIQDPYRAPVALGVGEIALRNPAFLLRVIANGPRENRNGAIDLLQDAFDMLSEDFEEEQFFIETRRALLAAPPGSATRAVAEALIETLEF